MSPLDHREPVAADAFVNRLRPGQSQSAASLRGPKPENRLSRMLGPLIRKLERYGPLSDEERRFLEESPARIVAYDDHAPLVREGDTPSESCLIVEGFACRFKSLPEGTRQIMAFHIAGDFCDLHSCFLKTMDHGIAAMPRCKVARVPHAKIREISERYPGLMRALCWDMAIDGAIHREWMISMGRRTAYEQIAHLLCELYLRLKAVGLADGASYEFPATQAELGDAFGLSTVHVNRMIQALRAADLITFKGGTVTIPDLERLMDVAGFDPAYLEVRGAPSHA
jgi:CRP-like cAMP-binding protein